MCIHIRIHWSSDLGVWMVTIPSTQGHCTFDELHIKVGNTWLAGLWRDGVGVSSDSVRALYIIRQLGIWWVKFFTLSNLQCKLPKNQENCFFSKSQPLQTLTCFSGIHNEKSQQLIIYMLFSTAYHWDKWSESAWQCVIWWLHLNRKHHLKGIK